MSDASLTAAFLAQVKQPDRWQAVGSLGPQLAELCERGRTSWPSLSLSPEQFIAHLATCGSGEEENGAAPSLASLSAADLYLACGCAQGAPSAMLSFEQSILSQLPSFLARLHPSADRVQEVGQFLRNYLFVARDGARPRICRYSGREPLSGWVRVLALRIALRGAQAKTERKADPASLDPPSGSISPELVHLHDSYKQQIGDCFRQALGLLRGEQRTLLRMRYIEGMSGTQLSTLFQINRTTAMRWLQEARFDLFDHTQRLLRQQLKLGETQFKSLIDVVLSRLDVSIASYLKE